MGIEELKTKRDDILRLAQLHGASHVRVFGSVAREEATEDSDVDFLVKADSQTSGLVSSQPRHRSRVSTWSPRRGRY